MAALLGLPDEVHVFGAEFDPLLDDSVAFGTRLTRLGKKVEFKLFRAMPHGCLRWSRLNDVGV